MKTYQILLVEDDPMVLSINQAYVDKMTAFQVGACAQSLEEAKSLLKEKDIDLVLADIQLNDGMVTDLMAEAREEGSNVDFILLTAQKDPHFLKDSLQYGAVDYILKPFSFDRLDQSLKRYAKRRAELAKNAELDQEFLDRYFMPNRKRDTNVFESEHLEKGITASSLKILLDSINQMPENFTIADLQEKSSFSHVTLRKYVHFLEERGYLSSSADYSKRGRPRKRYHKRQSLKAD